MTDHVNVCAWFDGSLNSAMQRRVIDVSGMPDPDARREMSQVLEYYPPAYRSGHRWVYPVKGEVPALTARDITDWLCKVRALLDYGAPHLKEPRGGREPWTDITLKAAGK
jgi:hypothetical protein